MLERIPTEADNANPDGLDPILKENLYANLRFPQTDFAIDIFTFRALLAGPDPKASIKNYLHSRLSDERAAVMLEHANRAHAAYLVKSPQIDAIRMMRLWRQTRETLSELLINILHDTGQRTLGKKLRFESTQSLLEKVELPITSLRVCFDALAEKLKSPEIQEKLTRYREFFREEERRRKEIEMMEREIRNAVIDHLQATVESRSDVDPAVAGVVERFLERRMDS